MNHTMPCRSLRSNAPDLTHQKMILIRQLIATAELPESYPSPHSPQSPAQSGKLTQNMPPQPPAQRYRFGVFEADAATGELRKNGLRIKLNAQPFQVLCMLLERPAILLTREDISRELWPDGTFVDYEHGVNSAINRIRETLGDTAANPRFVETVARRGYRFIAPVERITPIENPAPPSPPSTELPAAALQPTPISTFLASPEDLPRTSHPIVQTLFILLQLMYLSFYIGALANLAEIEDLFSPLARANQILTLMIVTAALLIPVRAFMFSAVLFHPPRAREKLLRLWPWLLLFDLFWSLSPFLLLHHISFGLALSCTALLVYSPLRPALAHSHGSRQRKPPEPVTASAQHLLALSRQINHHPAQHRHHPQPHHQRRNAPVRTQRPKRRHLCHQRPPLQSNHSNHRPQHHYQCKHLRRSQRTSRALQHRISASQLRPPPHQVRRLSPRSLHSLALRKLKLRRQ